MSFLKKLFGGGGGGGDKAPDAEVVTYKDFRITPTPIAEGNTFRISATIEKDTDGETRSHSLIRADTLQGREAAEEASVSKAKQVIDEQGDRIFR
ncbi:HlyU family transcriptional regulator [uncultured Roseobacter sp.]|uniref:HlyU family transcriptional regulator n=1 Tax=uncultured Roseobacter sp. TaxID=114847 RepID=UPI00262F2CF2|nr:HlyU family transcriptional regulator [uncultured Roseobacter sp.]